MNDPYKILGVSENASLTEINRAYKEKARKYHPDKSDDPQDAEQFIIVQRAYNFLLSEMTLHVSHRKSREIEYVCEDQQVLGGRLIGHCRCGVEVSVDFNVNEKEQMRTQCTGCSLVVVFDIIGFL